MKQIGSIAIKFLYTKSGIMYYRVLVTRGQKKKRLIIPRYDPLLGWIEIFGFPPQHEWCMFDWIGLGRLKPFTKTAMFSVGGRSGKETVTFNTDIKNKSHFITLTRTLKNERESFYWFEDYSNVPRSIVNHGYFSHREGIYQYEAEKKILNSKQPSLENNKQQKYYDMITKEKQRKPDIVIIKNFAAKGKVPPLYSDMFLFNAPHMRNTKGWILELGYLRKTGGKLERAHGNWYKLFELGKKCFVIEEECGPFRVEKINGVSTKIKDTYTKKLYTHTL